MDPWIDYQIMAAKCPYQLGEGIDARLARKDDAHQDTYGKIALTFQEKYDDAFRRASRFLELMNNEQDPKIKEMWRKEWTKAGDDLNTFKFGHTALEISAIKYPNIVAIRDELDAQFLARYSSERPAYSSPKIFTAKMQAVFNAIAYDVDQKLYFYKKVRSLFDKPMGSELVSTFTNKASSDDKAYDLPDVPTPLEFAHLKSSNQREDSGERTTIDNTIPTQLTNILSLANVSLNIMPGYLNSFSHLFMTVVY